MKKPRRERPSSSCRWPQLVGIFTQQELVLAHGVDCLVIVSHGYVAYAWDMVMMQAFHGSGGSMTPTWIIGLCFWMVQIPAAWLSSNIWGLGPSGVFWAIMIADMLLAVASIAVIRRRKWKTRIV